MNWITSTAALLITLFCLNSAAFASPQKGAFSNLGTQEKSCPSGYYYIPPCPIGKQCAWRGNVCMKYPTSPESWPQTVRPGAKLSEQLKDKASTKSGKDKSLITPPVNQKPPAPSQGEKPQKQNEPHAFIKGDMKSCITTEVQWGRNCGNPDSLKIIFHNQCPMAVELRYCLERTDGKMDCGSVSRFKVDDKANGAWVCSATGRYQWSATDIEE